MPSTLTDRRIREMRPPASGKQLYWDAHKDAPRGFGVRVTAAGTKSFVLRYRTKAGQERIQTIGEFRATWSLAAARQEASRLRALVDQGQDPMAERQHNRAEITLTDLVERFCKCRDGRLQSAPEVRRCLARDLLPALGKRRIGAITRADLIALVEARAREAPAAAGHLLGYIKQVFAFAEDRELLALSPAASLKPSRIDKALKTRQRGRVLDDAEIRGVCHTQSGMRPLSRVALKLILLTGQRPGEVLGLRWSEIDGTTWTIPASRRRKTETAHSVHLTDTALALLALARAQAERLQARRQWAADDRVFAQRAGGEPATVAGLDKAVTRAALAMGNKPNADWGHWTPHDLRRTCRTRLAALGIPEEIAERVIGHGKTGIVGVYNQYHYRAETRAALERWEQALLALVGEPACSAQPAAEAA
ncbi:MULTISPECIES: tyrosine-type recombinase/integrase [Thiorhodovibrio]|uniref:tyrosine-type recombinase/integrase n=1 Tax=Thiorhodovibrio TaxID=61593 RepID=UPI001914D057|nr:MULTISPECIES: site-specific integrase [Thiorhodovibrio]MBK5969036.1 integrase [Thiorhodovibrio winogradskyi]WPL15083.1 Prophage CP4-57 integrase [Thiorhodovibrio litoralis]